MKRMTKKKFSKIMVIISIVIPLIYSIIAIVYQFRTGNEMSSTLTTWIFTFYGVELLATAGIKISETVKSQSIIESTKGEESNG